MGRKFFLISQVFYPDEVSTAGLFTDLCIELAKRGVEVEVWCAHPSYNTRERQKKKFIDYKGVTIKYLASTNFRKNAIAGRILNMLSFSVSVIIKLLFSERKIRVFTHTTPPVLGIILSLISHLRKQEFIYILLDIFPEGLIRLGKVSEKNIFIRFWQFSFVKSLKYSTRIIVLGRDMKEWVISIYPGCIDKLDYIPHWKNADIEFLNDHTDNEYILNHHLENKFIVQYSGNMGLWNDMESIGRAVNSAPGDINFMFVGDGIKKKELVNTILKEKSGQILYLPFQPAEKIGALFSSCHIALVSLKAGLEGMAVPCKIYGILASGIPVIALVPANSEIACIVREENCGYVVAPEDSDGLLMMINKLKSDEKTRLEMGKNGRRAFLEKYTTAITADKYEKLIT